jgi:L-ascorbate metabolism protein UlaG (beta-lactamase superfamily)
MVVAGPRKDPDVKTRFWLTSGAPPLLLAALALVAHAASAAALPPADRLPSLRGGPIIIQPIFHASAQLEYANKVIHIDPWSQGDYTGTKPADLVLLTDMHPDHLDKAALARVLKPGAPIVAPKAVADQLTGMKNVIVLNNGQRRAVAGAMIEAVPMYNLQRGPAAGQLFHTKGRGNGYIVTLGGRRLYFSGDTENIPEARALKNIDVAFVCMNLPYTMPPAEAVALVSAMKPRIVYPYHYRGSNLQEFTDALKGQKTEVRLRDWYANPAATK